MWTSALVTLAVSACVGAVAVPSSYSPSFSLPNRATTRGCQQLESRFPGLVFFPNTTVYNDENTNFFSSSAILSPWCVFTPKKSQDIAGALKILRSSKTQFAVRGGGHTPIKGAASTSNGVLIAMDNFNSNQIGKFQSQQVAKVGSGQRWIDVYSWLEQYNLMVIGGRYAPVGVGGLLLGGGLSYFGSTRGWAADHVVNYEVVTADSQILQVNAQSHSDLFWALKGGASNFAIVTRYDLELFPRSDVWAGFISQNQSNADGLVQAVADFVDPTNGGVLDPNTAIDASLFYSTETKVISGSTSLFYNGSVKSTPPALKGFTAVPSTSSTVAPRTFSNWLNETTVFAKSSSRKLWTATSLKSTPEAVKLARDVYFAEIQKLRVVTGGTFTITWQPLSQAMVTAARASGGDAIDLDPKDGPAMAMLFGTDYTSAADDAYVENFIMTLIAKIDAKAKAANLYYPFVFLNDAGGEQKPLGLYGKGKSLPRLKAIAKTYDPSGVFQHLASGAFKLSQQ